MDLGVADIFIILLVTIIGPLKATLVYATLGTDAALPSKSVELVVSG